MKYNKFTEKRARLRSIFDTYCDIGFNLSKFNNIIHCDGDFGKPTGASNSDPIFRPFNSEKDRERYYRVFLNEVLERQGDFDTFYLNIESKNNRLYKILGSILNRCDYVRVYAPDEVYDSMWVEFSLIPSYEGLEDIKDTFEDVYDVLKIYNK